MSSNSRTRMASQGTAPIAGKKQLRPQLRAVRDALPAALRTKKSANACANAVTELSQHQTVAVYHAFRSELRPDMLVQNLRAGGARILYPRVVAHSRILEFCVIRDTSDLAPGALGILEPKPGLPPLPLSTIDALVVPALGFDAEGNRLGWGQGHYDHTLAQCPNATRVGICFQEQIVDSVPCEATDVPMHIVVTDTKRYQAARNTGAQREPS